MPGSINFAMLAIIAGIVLLVSCWRNIAAPAAHYAGRYGLDRAVLPWLGLAAGLVILGFGVFGAVEASQEVLANPECTSG